MSFRILLLISSILLVNACSSTTGNKDASLSDSNASKSTTERFQIESSDLEPFTPIPGSEVGAKASDRVFFSLDSSTLSYSAQNTLDRQINWLKKNPKTSFIIEGHCDERGTREYNLALGDRRANAVKNYLTDSGINSNRITVVSYGKERPAITGSNRAAWAENRRAVTVLK